MTSSAKKGKRSKQKAGLNLSMLDVGIGGLIEGIKYKLAEASGIFVEVPTQKVKPTQRCNKCWELTPKTLADRVHYKLKLIMAHGIITGGSSGIGKATAKLLASQGYHISLIARDLQRLKQASLEVEASRIDASQKVLTLVGDVSDSVAIEKAILEAIAILGPPTLLIASAGIAHPGYFGQIPLEIFERTMAVNYFGSLYSIKAVLPAMEQQKNGHIVLISSGVGLIGVYGYTSYSPTKFALRGLGESLRGELKPKGIKVSVVYPPDTDTPQLAAENLTKPPETKLITKTAKTWTAQAVALEIIRGVDKNVFVIAPGAEMTLLARLHSLLAPLLNWYFDRLVNQNSPKIK